MSEITEDKNERKYGFRLTNGLLGGIVLLLIGQLMGAIWWASAINTKVDGLTNSQLSVNNTASELSAKVSNHESKMAVYDATLAPRITALEQRISLIESRRP